MANIKRSVWELRFRALQERIANGHESLLTRIGRGFLEEDDVDLDTERARVEIYKILRKHANQLENTPPNKIFWFGE